MIRKPRRGLFITGTDTEVGKTYVASLIARRLVSAGHRVGVYKPAASGCHQEGGRSVSEDARCLWEAAGRPLTLEAVCPQTFAAPLAPHLAAAAEGRSIDADLLRDGLRVWTDQCDIVLVEGAGGFMSPLGDEDFVADLVYEFDYPLVVVAPNRLGTINHTLLTLIAISTFREGLDVAGVVLNDLVAPKLRDASAATNPIELKRLCVPPLLEHVRFGQTELPESCDWFELARRT